MFEFVFIYEYKKTIRYKDNTLYQYNTQKIFQRTKTKISKTNESIQSICSYLKGLISKGQKTYQGKSLKKKNY